MLDEVSENMWRSPFLLSARGPAGSAAQARSGGREHLVSGRFRYELVEGLADDRGRGATLRRCLDLGIPRVMCVFDPAIKIAATLPLARCPGIESIPVGTPQNRSD